MERRRFLALASAAAAFPRVALAQQAPAKLPRVAYLDIPRPKSLTDGFFQGLADRGYVDGKNIIVVWFTAPTIADLPAFAAKAVASAPAVIVAYGSTQALAAAQLTKTIPIVFSSPQDPVSIGLVSSLAHPGGNVTGAATSGTLTAGKLFGFLKEMVPNLSRVAFFGRNADGPSADAIQRADALAAGTATGIDITFVDVTDPDDLRPYFAQALAARARAIYLAPYAYAATLVSKDVMNALAAGQRQQPTYNAAFLTANNGMIERWAVLEYLALLNGLPSVRGIGTPGIATGGLLAYGEPNAERFRRAAHFVDDILRGAEPQDLPVELPTQYDFTINLKTARALGLVVPQSVLLTATEIFE